MRWQGRNQSSNIEDRRGQSSHSTGGKTTGIVGIIILLIGAYYGVDLSGLVGTPSIGTTATQQSTPQHPTRKPTTRISRRGFSRYQTTWREYFAKHGATYTPTTMVLYTGGTYRLWHGSGCHGTFLPCWPQNLSGFILSQDMRTKLGATGDTAFGYVIAHEVGHHVQNLLGTLPQVNQAQQQARSQAEANALSVRWTPSRLLCRHLGKICKKKTY